MNQEELKTLLQEETQLEEQLQAGDSPLNEPVIEKDIAGGVANPASTPTSGLGDAPEQPIGQQGQASAKPDFELPAAEAKMAAESILGVANHLIQLGGGFAINNRKHKAY